MGPTISRFLLLIDGKTSVDLFASQPTSSAVSSTTDFFDAADAVTTQVVGPPTSQPENKTSSSAVSSTTDFFAAPDPMTTKVVFPFVSEPDNKSEPEQVTIKTVDPFATVSSNTFDGSNLFGSVSSHSDSLSKEPSQNFLEDANPNNLNEKSQAESKTPSKDSFQVKSGIWADSLSRGLIDLNISASKKVNLADVGVVGLKETEETSQAPSTSYYMGRAMGTGSGLGRSDLPPSAPAGTDMFANFSG